MTIRSHRDRRSQTRSICPLCHCKLAATSDKSKRAYRVSSPLSFAGVTRLQWRQCRSFCPGIRKSTSWVSSSAPLHSCGQNVRFLLLTISNLSKWDQNDEDFNRWMTSFSSIILKSKNSLVTNYTGWHILKFAKFVYLRQNILLKMETLVRSGFQQKINRSMSK